ncbi:MAG TPA: two-component sensor histidine kinase, partial [Saprospiraceae bacterium]|nr:two-component sensor histidine kinase [Saprospiraceae bacterium]
MDIYTQKSRWKLSLGIAGVIIVIISMVYTNYLTGKLADEERNKANIWVLAMEDINNFDEESSQFCDYTLHTEILKSNQTIPVIVVNDRGGIDFHVNCRDTSTVALKREVEKMK